MKVKNKYHLYLFEGRIHFNNIFFIFFPAVEVKKSTFFKSDFKFKAQLLYSLTFILILSTPPTPTLPYLKSFSFKVSFHPAEQPLAQNKNQHLILHSLAKRYAFYVLRIRFQPQIKYVSNPSLPTSRFLKQKIISINAL